MVHADAFDDGLAAYQRGDFPAALNFWKPLAEQGHADAQYNVALIYYAGEGVPQDDAEGAKWLRMAAEQGVANAQNNLGVMYAEGRGLPEDNAEAVKWFRKAADQGYAQAQFNLGHMYFRGKGARQDFVHAHMWFSLAAAQDFEGAQEDRDMVAEDMTTAQIAKAQRMAREWLAKHQQ